MDEHYKSVLIVNRTCDADITFYVYLEWDFICWLSYTSKIVKPGEKYYHRSESGFKYRIVARSKDKRTTKTVVELKKWTEDKLVTVSDSLDAIEGRLDNFPHEKKICVRKLNRDKDVSSYNGRRNLYEILKLDIDKVRKMPLEEQNKTIRQAYHREIRRWHPDHNYGDEEIAREVIMAYDVLGNPEARARYNNLTDYDGGWFSKSRFGAVFWPECHTEEQKWAYRKRMMTSALSLGLSIGGLIVTAASAGVAAPALVATGAVIGSGMLGAGVQSLPQTVNREAIGDGCDTKKWLAKAAIGSVAGAATGGAAVGITAEIVGIGSVASESAAVSLGQYLAVGASTGATGGAITSLGSDAAGKLVDGQDITWKQALGHALCGGGVGALAGAAGGAVTKAAIASQTSAATVSLNGEIGEQVAILTGPRRIGNSITKNFSRALTENSTEVVMGSAAQFVEERLDDSVENRSPTEHLLVGAQKWALTAFKDVTSNCASAVALRAINETKITERAKKERIASYLADRHDTCNRNQCIKNEMKKTKRMNKESKMSTSTEVDLTNGDEHVDLNRARIRKILDEEANEHLINWKECRDKGTYQAAFVDGDKERPRLASVLLTLFETGESDYSLEDGQVKYIYEGPYWCKMVATYILENKEQTEEVNVSGNSIDIPAQARQIKVKFQVGRLSWVDVLKYDRFQRCWCKPYQAHVFKFDFPPIRTFTISGPLFFEAVMKVTNEYHDDTTDM